ncbi:AMP-binding protein [Microbacterium lacus]|uniref:AMP-binding protein n=1 Tax=Microbacterium lacus TaxID=415217 RepID=UPI00384BAC52
MRVDKTVAQSLEHWADARPDHRFLIIADSSRSYGEVRSEAWRIAGALAARGVGLGDRVAVMAPTSVQTVTTLLAVAGLGAITVPLNIYLKGDALRHQLTSSGCRALVTDAAGLGMVRQLVSSLPDLQFVVVVDGEAPDTDIAGRQLIDYLALASEAAPIVPVNGRDEDTYAILYTSGTTGLPKGCVISNGQTKHWARYTEALSALTDDDVVFTAAPLFHVGGQTPLLGALAVGIPVVIESGFSASRYLARATEVGATVAVAVGWIAQALLKQPPSDCDKSHTLRAMSTVQLSVAEQEQFAERFGIRTLTQQYGQTECYPIAYNPFAEQAVSPYTGRPAPALHVAIHDDAGRSVAPGVVGEIVVRPREPHAMFERYWGDDAATVKAFDGLWFHTGDLGREVDGELQYVDRKKDSMRRRGENVSAFELERTLARFENVTGAAVIGVEIEGELDQSIKAVLVVTNPDTFDLGALAAYMAHELPYFAVPQYIEIVPELPRNASGRVMKDQLRAVGVNDATRDLIAMGLGVTREQRRASTTA